MSPPWFTKKLRLPELPYEAGHEYAHQLVSARSEPTSPPTKVALFAWGSPTAVPVDVGRKTLKM